jgi:hypothetical protein
MEKKGLYCINCEHQLEDNYKYCPECGQKTKVDLTLSVLFDNAVNNYFSVDARFFISFLPLIFQPGYLPREYVSGKRLKYLHPAQFYLFISVIFFFIFSFETRKQQAAFDESVKDGLINVSEMDSADVKLLDSLKTAKIQKEWNSDEIYSGIMVDSAFAKTYEESTTYNQWDFHKLDSLIAINAPKEEKIKALGYKKEDSRWKRRAYIQLLKIYEKKGGGLLDAFYDTIPIAMFFLLPIFALFLKMLFFKKGRFSHHLVFSFYYFSFLFALFSVLLLANLIYPIPNWIDWLLILSAGLYLLIGIIRFYGQTYIKSFIKTSMLLFMYLMVVLPTSFLVLIFISFLMY